MWFRFLFSPLQSLSLCKFLVYGETLKTGVSPTNPLANKRGGRGGGESTISTGERRRGGLLCVGNKDRKVRTFIAGNQSIAAGSG